MIGGVGGSMSGLGSGHMHREPRRVGPIDKTPNCRH